MRVLRWILALTAVLLVSLAVGAFTAPTEGVGLWLVDVVTGLLPLAGTATAGLWVIGAWVVTYPLPTLVIVSLACAPVLIARIIELIPRRVNKDPQRMFSPEERRVGIERSGDRCEMEDAFFLRCRRKGEHGDHWFPHSKGGASSLNNFVWACAPCNLSKSAHVPSFWETTRLEWRRRRYFDPGVVTRPGEKVRVR